MKDLIDVYDNNDHLVGTLEGTGDNPSNMLLPVFHNTQKTHIEVTITENGEFVRADVIKNEVTVIPITLDSLSRTNNIHPHPLHEKLIYLDPHCLMFLKDTKANGSTYFHSYFNSLKNWKDSSYSHPFVVALYRYIAQKRIVQDLIEKNVLILNEENGKFLEKWKGNKVEKPLILQVVDKQHEAFVRFRMITNDGEIYEPWTDKEIWDLSIKYQYDLLEDFGLCYITGEETKITTKHPKFIRYDGDQAKLISSPSNKNMITYQGLFNTPEQAVTVGAIPSLKAHNALRWLIRKQGIKVGDTYFILFGTGTKEPQMFLSELEELFIDESDTEYMEIDNTEETLAQKLDALIKGYNKEIPQIGNHVVLMSVDASTKGRLSITNYMKFDTKLYFDILKKWHTTASWIYRDKGKTYIGSPSINKIISALYGKKPKEGISQHTAKQLLPCILNQQPIPQNIIHNIVFRALKRYRKEEKYQKKQTIDVACSLIRHNKGGELKMSLDTENINRSYLFGRLLAIAEYYEGTVIEWKRETNAEKLMHQMYFTPANTWTQLYMKLQPYFQNKEYRWLKIKCKKMIEEIITQLGDDFNNKPLEPEFLVGYSTQKKDLKNK